MSSASVGGTIDVEQPVADLGDHRRHGGGVRVLDIFGLCAVGFGGHWQPPGGERVGLDRTAAADSS